MYLGVKLGEHEFKFEGGSEDHCRQMYREWRRVLSDQFGIRTDQELQADRIRAAERLARPSSSLSNDATFLVRGVGDPDRTLDPNVDDARYAKLGMELCDVLLP